MSLAALARGAAFSPFHFHRVFRAVTGETLFGFIQRLRLERAAGVLLAAPDRSVLEVALDHGFASSATFARAFKGRFGMSATAWRRGGAQRWPERRRLQRKLGKQLRKPGNARRRAVSDTSPVARARSRRPDARWRKGEVMNVRVQELPPRRVVYTRYVGPYGAQGIPELWQRFVVPDDFRPDGSVNLVEIPGGRFAVAQFEGSAHDIESAWDRVFATWLPGSGYQPDDRPCIEVYRGRSVDATTGAFRCELCLPVRPL